MAQLKAAPYIVFKDLRHGSETVPFHNSNPESFFSNLLVLGHPGIHAIRPR